MTHCTSLKPVHLHLEANKELRDSKERYREADPELAHHFLDAAEEKFRRISRSSGLFPIAIEGTAIRRCRIPRFPYAIFFEVKPKYILVLSVAHDARRAEYLGKSELIPHSTIRKMDLRLGGAIAGYVLFKTIDPP